MVVPFESAVECSLEGSRGDRVYVPATCRALDQADRVTPLSGTQLGVVSTRFEEEASGGCVSVRLVMPRSMHLALGRNGPVSNPATGAGA